MKVFTTGQVAKICKVAPRTVSKWFDEGRLEGYRIPGSQDRRMPGEKVMKFMRTNGMPLEAARRACYVNAIMIARSTPFIELVQRTFDADGRFDLVRCDTTYDAGTQARLVFPDAIIVDFDNPSMNVLGFLDKVRSKPEMKDTFFMLLLSDGSQVIRHDVAGQTEGFRKPFDPGLLKQRLLSLVGKRKGVA